jgi:parallel beta-helix repeat protein
MKKLITAAVLVVSIMCFTGIAFAVTPIYGWSTPVKITKSGSYQLQTNIVFTNVNTTAILVQADNVTIDLNGFSILGPNICSGFPLSCNQNGTGKGIDATGHQNIKVYNGTVRGMGNNGIATGDLAIIESVRVIGNGGGGIAVNGNGMVSSSTVNGNGVFGIIVTSGMVSNNTVNGNGNSGIAANNYCTVNGNTVTANGYDGINVVLGGTVSGNTVRANGHDGISVGGDGTVSGNSLRANGNFGISVGGGTVSGNSVEENGYIGISVGGGGGTVSGNTVNANGNDGIFVFINGGGTVSGNTVANNAGYGIVSGPTTGYVNNVLAYNIKGNVSGGVNLKPNLCSGVLCP